MAGNRVKVTITYMSSKLGHSRYGYVQRMESAVRFIDESELDIVLDQFRSHAEIIEVLVTRQA